MHQKKRQKKTGGLPRSAWLGKLLAMMSITITTFVFYHVKIYCRNIEE